MLPLYYYNFLYIFFVADFASFFVNMVYISMFLSEQIQLENQK